MKAKGREWSALYPGFYWKMGIVDMYYKCGTCGWKMESEKMRGSYLMGDVCPSETCQARRALAA